VQEFGDLLKQSSGIKIEYLDERFTSRLATEKLREVKTKNNEKGDVDNTVAQILLQQYLDKQKNK
jgi:RNase H-fold protein (predicted Holliday junction resolvase)